MVVSPSAEWLTQRPKKEGHGHNVSIGVSEILVFTTGRGLVCETESSKRDSSREEKDERHA